jgi:hypothetical protein
MNYSEERMEELRHKYSDDSDDSSFESFRLSYLEDEDAVVNFDIEGYVYNDVAVVEDYSVFLSNNEDEYIELKGRSECEFWFNLIGKRLLIAELDKQSYNIEKVKD